LPEELYETPRADFSQGDIIESVPHLYLHGPLLAAQKEAETIYRVKGEPFPSFDDKQGQTILASCKRQRALLLTHDCEIDKPQTNRWLVCPVVPVVLLAPETRDRARRNRIFSMLHLPAYRDRLPESFVDFNQISTIDRALVSGAARLVSLSDIGRRALYGQFIRWISRWQLRELNCPNCDVAFNPADNLPVRVP